MNSEEKYEKTLSNVISDVLNELWEDIKEEEKVKIVEHIESIRFHYSNISKLSELDEEDEEYQKMITSPDFDEYGIRFAYVLCYTASHADFVFQTLVRCFEKSPDILKSRRFVCVGGGPGSDVLGILKFMLNQNISDSIMFDILDLKIAWKSTWQEICNKYQQSFHTSYLPFDILGIDEKFVNDNKWKKFDVFTFIYVLSALLPQDEDLLRAKKSFCSVFMGAKKGSYFVFIDNGNTKFYKPYLNWTKEHNLSEIVNDIREQRISKDERSSISEYVQNWAATVNIKNNKFIKKGSRCAAFFVHQKN